MMKSNPMIIPINPLLFYMVIFMASVWFLVGCSTYYTARRTTKKITRDMMASDEDLKKSIAIMKFENHSYYTNDKIEEIFQSKITETLQTACTNIHLILPRDKQYPEPLKAMTKTSSGRIDNLKLVQVGRLYGIGAIATGAILNVSAYQEKRGLFWLREDHAYLQVQIHLEVFDTETGAKLLDENRLEEVEIEEDDYSFIKEKRQVPIKEISDKIQFTATLLGEKICDSLINQSWKSYVVSMDGDKMVIFSGKNDGLQPGDIYDIYNTGRLINGLAGERFLLPGKKVGIVQVMQVHLDKAEAILLEGEGIKPGDIVKPQ